MPPKPPVARVGGPYQGVTGQSLTVDPTASTPSPGATLKSGTLGWGDGDTTTWTGKPALETHVYQAAGTFSLVLTVWDTKGRSAVGSTTASITVMPPTPLPPGTPIPPLPSAPAGLSATAGDAQVSLSWGVTSGAVAYQIHRSTVNGGPYTQIAELTPIVTVLPTSYVNTGLANGTPYYYVVTASNATGRSGNSNQASATPVAAAVAPAAPSNLTAALIASTIKLDWVDNANNETSVQIERKLSSTGSFALLASVGANVITYTDATGVLGQTYNYRVRAFNGTLASAYSNTATQAMPPAIPVAPTNLQATAGDAQVSLTWTASFGATSYSVKRGTVNGGPYTQVATGLASPSYTNTGLSNGTAYYFVVTATNSSGTSGHSNQATATPVAAAGPTFYVSTTGNNGFPGTQAQPWRTIAFGASQLSAGDTLLVRGGTYDERLSTCPSGISWANKVRIASYPGETVWMTPSSGLYVIFLQGTSQYIEFDGINLDGRAPSLVHAPLGLNEGGTPPGTVHHIRFKNAEIISGPNAGYCAAICTGASYCEFQNLVIHGGAENLTSGGCGPECNQYGFYPTGNYNIFENNTIYNTAGQAIQIYNGGGWTPVGNIIRNNRIHSITRSGNPSGDVNGILIAGNSNEVYNNILYELGTVAGGAAIDIYSGSGNKIWNNTIYNTTTAGVKISTGVSGTEVKNNIIYLQQGTAIPDSGIGSDVAMNLTTNPNFVNPSAGDFHLLAGSPAINAGVAVAQVTTDFDGVVRGNPPDIGAYEKV